MFETHKGEYSQTFWYKQNKGTKVYQMGNFPKTHVGLKFWFILPENANAKPILTSQDCFHSECFAANVSQGG